MLALAIESVRSQPGLEHARVLLGLHHRGRGAGDDAYERAVHAHFSVRATGVAAVVVSRNASAERAFVHLIEASERRYYLLYEHDWAFCKRIHFESLLRELEECPNQLHYVRFNKHANEHERDFEPWTKVR